MGILCTPRSNPATSCDSVGGLLVMWVMPVVIVSPVPILYVTSLLTSSFHSSRIMMCMRSEALVGISTATGFLCVISSDVMPSMRNARHVSVLTLCLS